jgi:hypothetical protein
MKKLFGFILGVGLLMTSYSQDFIQCRSAVSFYGDDRVEIFQELSFDFSVSLMVHKAVVSMDEDEYYMYVILDETTKVYNDRQIYEFLACASGSLCDPVELTLMDNGQCTFRVSNITIFGIYDRND